MNMHVEPGISGAALPCLLFKAGQFVRLKGGETVGRVLEDTDASSWTKVQIFDDQTWTGTPSFGPGCLTMWTPDIALPVVAPTAKAPPLGIEELGAKLMKILGAFELIEELATAGIAEGGNDHLNHFELLGSTFADLTSEILEALPEYSDAA